MFFYQSLFSRKVKSQTDKKKAYLKNIPLPKLTNEQTLSCEGIISEDETSIHKPLLNQELSTSQKQAVIKMLQKKTKIRDSLGTGGRYVSLIQI